VPTQRELAEALERRKAAVREMGGRERVERQRARGKLTARERIALLFDRDSFEEFGILGKQGSSGSS
jgi:propionyl-CoA carboxylase beta chain